MQKLGVGIIGTGWVSNEHIRAFQANPHTRVAAIVSRDRDRAAAKAREHGLSECRPYDAVEDMLQNREVQIAVVCTPHHLHARQAVAAAESGRHVLVEKPLATTLADGHAVANAVKRAGVKSLVSYVLRWNPLFETIKAMLGDGFIGSVSYAEVDYMHPIGAWYTGYEWMRKKETGGSNLLAGGCHAVDALRWFVGSEAVEVFAYANTGPRNHLGYEYDANSITLVKFASGVIAKIGCTIEAPMPYRFHILLAGDEGTIRNNQFFKEKWTGQKDWATIPTILPDTAEVTHHPFQGEIDHFVDCILSGRESHCDVADALNTHEICLASEISAHEGRPVRLPLSS